MRAARWLVPGMFLLAVSGCRFDSSAIVPVGNAKGKAGGTGRKATHERAENTDHDVPDQAHAMSGYNLAGQESGDQADDDPNDDCSKSHSQSSMARLAAEISG